jgi:4-amino-4-deoxy-L-arabinose transferase-like glycosyltransferase
MSVVKQGVPLALLCFAVLALLALDSDIKMQSDSGVYITLAKSLSAGEGYREIFLTDRPPHTLYPPVFPLLLAPVLYLFGDNFLAMKLLLVAMAMITLYLTYRFYRDVSDDLMAFLVVMFTATSHGLLFYSQSIMSEIPYLFFSVLALCWLHRYSHERSWSVLAVAMAAALISLAYLTRLIGLSLLLATVIYLIGESAGELRVRIKRAAVITGLAAIPAVLWFLRNWTINQYAGGPYWFYYSLPLKRASAAQSPIHGIIVYLAKLAITAYDYTVHAGRVIVFYLPSPSWVVLPLLLALLIFAGFIWCVLRKRTIVEYYVFFYLCLLLPFPGSRQQRYLIPLLPFIWYYFFTATAQLLRWLRQKSLAVDHAYRRGVMVAATLLVVFLLIANGTAAVIEDIVYRGREGYYHRVSQAGFMDMLQWVKAHTPPDSLFMGPKSSLGFLLAGRKAVQMAHGNPEAVLRYIHAQAVDYVVLDSLSKVTQRRLRPVVEEYPDRFSLAYARGRIQVYRVTTPHRNAGPPAGQ